MDCFSATKKKTKNWVEMRTVSSSRRWIFIRSNVPEEKSLELGSFDSRFHSCARPGFPLCRKRMTETGGFQELPGTSPRPQNRRLRGGQSLHPINRRDVVRSRNRGLRRKDLVTQPLKPLVTSHQPPHASRNLVVHRRMPACASVFVAPKNEPRFLSRISTFRSANKLNQPLPSSPSPDQPVGFSFDIQELTHRPLPEGLGMVASPCPTFPSSRA
ncbi:hypothetical protein CGRA01v4_05277 [Colletotrichum graminicola]|nr:hypothetical protein CGRA01v4_05277 [Colletotrichum graminicola]